ncbi:MAG: LptF/LptG family permease [Gemmatales bacterium]|nr:LptF/LptG family permease [Gemmatales bacterium]MDW7995423.1 LptF/LptG family permease [Gemmatales bacterium]
MLPWHILQRTIAADLLRVFALGLVAITSVLVLVGIIQEATQQGLALEQTLRLVPLLVPGFMPYTVPATCLLAVSVVYGRMAHDNEITALKAAGIPATRVIWPAFVLGVACSAGLFLLVGDTIPRLHHRLRSIILEDVEEWLYARLRRDRRINEPKLGYAIWVKEVQGRRLISPTFVRRDAQGRDEIIAVAREAELQVDMQEEVLRVYMVQGEIVRDYQGPREVRLAFDEEVLPVPLPPTGLRRTPRPREMTNRQIRDRLASILYEQSVVSRQLHEALARGDDANTSPSLKQKQAHLEYLRNTVNELRTELAQRPALASSCIFFVLIGSAVGIWFHRRDYLSSFVTCFLPIVLTYYPLMMFGINMGKKGQLDPRYGMWMGNALLGVVGLALLVWIRRR